MIELKVYYLKKEQFGSIVISSSATFADARDEALSKYSDEEDPDESIFSVCTIEIPHSFVKQRRRNNFTPYQTAVVADTIQLFAEVNVVGAVWLTIIDVRNGASPSSYTPLSASEILYACLLATSDKPDGYEDDESCTSWATTGFNSMGCGAGADAHAGYGSTTAAPGAADAALTAVPWLFQHSSVLESLFLEVSSVAVIQGRLNRKISNPRRQDTWREEYCVLDGRTDRLWLFPFTSDHSASTAASANASALRELGVSGLGVPSFIPLLSGCKTKANEAVSVSTHRSDATSFTVTIVDDWLLDPAAAYAGRLYSDQRSYTFRAASAEKAGKWVSRMSSLHAMLHQPLLPPGPDNLRLYKPAMAQFVAKYTEGESTYLSAAEAVFQAQTGTSTASHFHSSVVTSLAACGGGGTADADGGAAEGPQIPVTARCASHWAGNCMLESIEDCIAVTQQGNSERDLDVLESLMTFEGMLKNKYLRGYFQKYLANNCTEETLLFWQYAEDYWRAHPYSAHSFTPATTSSQAAAWSSGGTARHDVARDVLEALKRQDAVMLASADAVRQWAESLFLTFLHCNAPYQIGCCTVADIALVSATIDNLRAGELPPYNLFRAVQLSTFSFMKSIFYPDFIAQPNYHRILVAAIHAADRVAMNATILATCVAPDREVPAFDFTIGSEESNSSPALGPSVGIIPARRGLLGLMKGMVTARRTDGTGVAGAGGSEKEHSTRVDAKNYAARWRTSKLVVFEQVRGTLPLTITVTSTSTAATATSVGSTGGNALYRLRKRNDKRRSVIGDKMKKLRALQNGAVRKIAWLPEWWWDLLPPISVQAELASASEVDRSEEWLEGAEIVEGDVDERERMLSECTLLDEAEDPFQADRARGGGLSGPGVDYWRWIAQYVDGEWMPNDMNALNASMEKVRQVQAQQLKDAVSRPDLHMGLLLAKLLAAEEKRGKQALPHARQGSLYLPAGWKASDAKATAESVKKAVIAEVATVQVPAMVKYTSTIPRCISQLNLSRGRILLEDYAHLQPVGFHMNGAVAGLGTLVMCSIVRCRYLRPTSKPVGMLMRGFSKRSSQFASDSAEPDINITHTPPRARRAGAGATAAVRGESVVIASVPPYTVAPPAPTAYSRTALQGLAARAPRSEEFSVPAGSGNSCSDWPRQCAALYVCLGVPRLFLVDPVTWVPSACLDLHAAQRIGPSEQYLQSFDIKDKTHCTWQISPEGIDAEDAREVPRRWLLTLSALCLPTTTVVTVVKAGYLQKRGRVNRAFKLRWFVLTTDLKLRYYKDDQIGVLKGTIDMSRGKNTAADALAGAGMRSSGSGAAGTAGTERVARFDKEIVVTAQGTGRMFTLLAEDAATAEDWLAVLNDLLESPLGDSGQLPGESIDLSSHSGLSGSLMGDGDAEEDEDEGEDD